MRGGIDVGPGDHAVPLEAEEDEYLWSKVLIASIAILAGGAFLARFAPPTVDLFVGVPLLFIGLLGTVIAAIFARAEGRERAQRRRPKTPQELLQDFE